MTAGSQDPNLLPCLLQAIESLRADYRNLADKIDSHCKECSLPARALSHSSDGFYTIYSSNEAIDADKSKATDESVKKGVALPADRPALANPSLLLYNHRIVLTTYPGQVGVNPIPLIWGASEPEVRGPIVCSRIPESLKLRNAIGAHGGSYSVYRALAIAIRELEPHHKPNLHNTYPVVQIGPFPSWNDPMKIVSLDPWGAMISQIFKKHHDAGVDVRPTIAITKAHMRVSEIQYLVQQGSLKVDGTVVLGLDGDLAVVKGAVEPVWYLPGIADRFKVDETTLRRALFEDTGGMYPELVTRPDLKVFLPPIGNLSIYIFGNPDFLADPSRKLTLRVHDECNGSDVFGSDICTCRPYLIYGIEECVRTAQEGGVGLIVYFRKEGRALGEVTKYLVYNARKRAEGGDTAAAYFQRTENIAGVKDMRFQATMPDVLHWLGIQKIDKMISMSNMKYDAIVDSGIPILERVPIPEGMLPPDSQVEINAKIAAGYFSKTTVATDLEDTKGRNWEDIQH
ncbi:GTP cyclohydrolase N terminal-domain-containing protein [Polychytrium aggregatum]|uniref:GTP cyclohydrolase N terminal-domain-containing protein n=1 Tax=Polychytrium aggregatum TaxID=110093 RepID=UPI0022FEA3A8|nr:GTP cyclohydrolase N terminal-domain-containing protein [Polychytrium aggregatum]KAI9208445.1 GTP cyclohydrolase N terminal-domain-containing protein [Polychytrium aggregatum]